MLNENVKNTKFQWPLKSDMERLAKTVARIEDDLICLHEDISEVFETLENLEFDDDNVGPSLDVEPHVLVSGPYKGKTALQWLCGNFAHNDITIPRSSIKEAYDYFDVPRGRRIPYLF